jgi:hypothetical protein
MNHFEMNIDMSLIADIIANLLCLRFRVHSESVCGRRC